MRFRDWTLTALPFLFILAALADRAGGSAPQINYPAAANSHSKRVQFCLGRVQSELEDLRSHIHGKYKLDYGKFHYLSLKAKSDMRDAMAREYDKRYASARRYAQEFERLLAEPPGMDARMRKFQAQNPALFAMDVCENYFVVSARRRRMKRLFEEVGRSVDTERVRRELQDIRKAEPSDDPYAMEQWEYCRAMAAFKSTLDEIQEVIRQDPPRDAGLGFSVKKLKVEPAAPGGGSGWRITGEILNENAGKLEEPAVFVVKVFDPWSKNVRSHLFQAQPSPGGSAGFSVPLPGLTNEQIGRVQIECRKR